MRIICIRCQRVAERSPCPACQPSITRTGRGYGTEWERLSLRVRREERGMCYLCGGPGADTADHVIPLARGGTNTRANMRAAHRACNGRKGAGWR